MEMRRLDSAVEIPVYKNDVDHDDSLGSTPQAVSGTLESSTSPHRPDTAYEEHRPQLPSSQSRSRLLSLPPELQLLIWEFAVIEDEPLYVNGPCDSSFGGWNDEYYADVELWKNGTKQPPEQPYLTRVCRDIRVEALPMFYKHNRFQSGYCYETDMDMTLRWLRGIGDTNRKLMKRFYFFDANFMHDLNWAKDIKRVQRGPVMKEMGGSMCSSYSDEGCRHEVLFGTKVEDEELEALVQLFGDEMRMY